MDFKLSLVFVIKISTQYKMLYRFGMHFSARGSSFFFAKYGARPFFRAQIFFHDLFVLVFFQDEVKQLSSWKFFDWNRFGNRFGNDVSKLKKQEGLLRVKCCFTNKHHYNAFGTIGSNCKSLQ